MLAPLPAGIRSRFVDGVNDLRMHVLEAGFEPLVDRHLDEAPGRCPAGRSPSYSRKAVKRVMPPPARPL